MRRQIIATESSIAPAKRRRPTTRNSTARRRNSGSTGGRHAHQVAERFYGETEGLTTANRAITDKAGITLGNNNVMDDNPSISASVGTTGNGNTFPQTYDAMGRYVFLRARMEF